MIPTEPSEARRLVRLPARRIHVSSNLSVKFISRRVTLECERVMYTRRSLVFWLLAAYLVHAQEGQPTVQVTGAVKQILNLSADDLAKMPRASVRTANNGMETVYEGVWLHEVLKRAG